MAFFAGVFTNERESIIMPRQKIFCHVFVMPGSGFEQWEGEDGTLYFPDDLGIGEQIEREFSHAEELAMEADPMAEIRRNITNALNASRRENGEGVTRESDLWDSDNDGRDLVEAA